MHVGTAASNHPSARADPGVTDSNPGISTEWFGILPWFVPVVALSFVIGLAVSRALGRRLKIPPWVGVGMVCAVGVILASTLTPLGPAAEGGRFEVCDFSRVGIVELGKLRRINDESLNVLLFIPIGLAVAAVPGWKPRVGLFVAAVALPVVIEAIQLLVPILRRGCESADIVDNLTGLIVGLGIGMVMIFIGGRSWTGAR